MKPTLTPTYSQASVHVARTDAHNLMIAVPVVKFESLDPLSALDFG